MKAINDMSAEEIMMELPTFIFPENLQQIWPYIYYLHIYKHQDMDNFYDTCEDVFTVIYTSDSAIIKPQCREVLKGFCAHNVRLALCHMLKWYRNEKDWLGVNENKSIWEIAKDRYK